MAFRNYDRKLFAKLEGTGGTAETPDGTNFIESVNPTFTVTPLMFERQPKTMTFTPNPMTVPGTATNAGVAMIEFSFSVELCGPGTGVASGTAPEFDELLRACGLEKLDVYKTALTSTGALGTVFNREGIDTTTYVGAENYAFGDNSEGDDELWLETDGDFSGTTLATQHSGTTMVVGATTTTQFGVGYRPLSANSDDENANTSCTIRLYLDKAGTYVQGKGCRGTFEIPFVHGDRALINFTFQGVFDTYNESGSDITDYGYTMEVPPAFINAGMSLGKSAIRSGLATGSLFNALTFTLGNETVVREDTNDADGMTSAIITGRAGTLTFNPDNALQPALHDEWEQFLSGNCSRVRWSYGSTAGNRVDFRVSNAQFTGVADGERDTVSVLDSTTNMTGGTYGSSLLSQGGAQTNSTQGADNEFVMVFR